MEPGDETKSLSPPLTPAQASDPKLLAGLISAAGSDTGAAPTLKRYSLSKGDDPNLLASEKPSLNRLSSDIYYRLVKTSTSYRFCFDRRYIKPHPYADMWIRNSALPPAEITIPLLGENLNDPFIFKVANPIWCGEKPKRPEDHVNKGMLGERISLGDNFFIKLRSVEEIFLFLGEMVRTELGIADGRLTSMTVPGKADRPLDLFRVERRKPAPGEIAVSFKGDTFVVSPDPSGSDKSTTVIQLLTDLLALQSSAKSLPTPNVIPFLSAP